MEARIKTLPRLGHTGHLCIFLLLRRAWGHPSTCPWTMRQEIMGFSCSKWDLLQWQKLSRMKYCIILLMGVVAPLSSWAFKTRLEKHLSGVISVELLLPWGMEVGLMASWGPWQPCFLWSLIQDFSLLISWSPKGDRTITLDFYPYTVFFAGCFLLILRGWLQLHLSYVSPSL